MAGGACAFRALVDSDGSRQGPHHGYAFVANDVLLETVPREPVRLKAYLPSTLTGESGPASVLVVRKDAAHNVVEARMLPASTAECRPFASTDERVQRIEVRELAAGAVCVTNPCRLVAPDDLRLYRGDLHVHTCLSDDASAERGPGAAAAFARDTMEHDFVAITDHVNNVRAEGSTVDAARRATRSGRFVALAEYELERAAPARRLRGAQLPGVPVATQSGWLHRMCPSFSDGRTPP
jgi:hypothetical protein